MDILSGRENNGLFIVYTGDGKGKTTATLGLALRAWGQGMKVLIIQFIKGDWQYGELKAAEKLGPNFEIRQLGKGFIYFDKESSIEPHREAAREALAVARREITGGDYDLVILDEVLYALSYGLIDLSDVMKAIDEKPPGLHLVFTGRNAPPQVTGRADLVTETKEIKHPFHHGQPAQKGIEY